ncbi:MAG: XdhC family protein [Thermoanaerobaculia bacterium]
MHSAIFERLRRGLEQNELFALATVVAGPGVGNQILVWPGGQFLGDLGAPRLNQRASIYAEQAIPEFGSARKSFRQDGDAVDVFFEVFAPPPKLILVGAVHVAISLIAFAKLLGFRSVVIDPRTAFATAERFADADRLILEWPAEALEDEGINENTYLAVLSHDLKIDLPALEVALRSRARYIGALGSKKTHAKRVAALKEAGFGDEELGRIHSPIGLPLGGRHAEEIALAIIAQVVAARYGLDA